MTRVIHQQILYRDSRFYSAFPSIAALDGGESLLVFRRARDLRTWLCRTRPEAAASFRDQVDHVDARSHLCGLRLDRQLRPLGAPDILPIDPECADQDASLLQLTDRQGRDSLLLGSFSWYPLGAAEAAPAKASRHPYRSRLTDEAFVLWGCWTSRSQDQGHTWSPRRYLPARPDGVDPIPGVRPLHGGGLRGSAVSLGAECLWASYGGASQLSATSSCHLYRSSDHGHHWRYDRPIAWDPAQRIHFHEPALTLTPGGRLIALLRTGGLDDHLASVESSDLGATWSPWRVHSAIGHPYHPLRLADGRVWLTYGYRHPPYGVRARLLDPELSDLDQAPEMILCDDAPHGDCGYPWSCCLDQQHLLTVYYLSDDQGRRMLRGTVVML